MTHGVAMTCGTTIVTSHCDYHVAWCQLDT